MKQQIPKRIILSSTVVLKAAVCYDEHQVEIRGSNSDGSQTLRSDGLPAFYEPTNQKLF